MEEQMNPMSQFLRFSRCAIKLSWKVISRFQSTCDVSEFSFLAQPRQKIAAWHMESVWIKVKSLWKSIFYVWFTQRSRAKKQRCSPWSLKDADYSHKWRQTESRHNSNTDICDKAVFYEFYDADGITAELRRFDSKTKYYLLWFSIRCFVVDQRSGDGRFGGWFKIIAINCRQDFPEFLDAGRESCICSQQDHPELLFQERGQPRGAESSERGSIGFHEEDRSPSWSTTTFEWLLRMIQGYCEKCVTLGFCIKRFRCTRFSRWKVSGKPDAESLGTNWIGTIH